MAIKKWFSELRFVEQIYLAIAIVCGIINFALIISFLPTLG
jgi:hypothetical protein